MNKLVLAGLTCTVLVAACSNSHVPDDAQITALLRLEHAQADDPKARLEASAVSCLRAWSGDPKLIDGLAIEVNTDAGRKACREHFAPWFADPTRNPKKFTFEDFSQPPVAKRALDLYVARAGFNNVGTAPPAALTAPKPPKPVTPIAPMPQMDLGAAGDVLKQTEDVCQLVQQRAAAEPTNQRARRFGEFCTRRLQKLRADMQDATTKHNLPRLDQLIEEAKRLATVGNEAAGRKQ